MVWKLTFLASLCVVAFVAPAASAADPVCTPERLACLFSGSEESGSGDCEQGDYYGYRFLTALVALDRNLVMVALSNNCQSSSDGSGSTVGAAVGAQAPGVTDAHVAAFWFGGPGFCDSWLYVRAADHQTSTYGGCPSPTGEGPGMLLPPFP